MRPLKRMLIWWRWPMAVVAALLIAAILPSGWYDLYFKLPMFPDALVRVYAGYIHVGTLPGGWSTFRPINWVFDEMEDGPEWFWWKFEFEAINSYRGVSAPLWAVALPPLSLASAGFWLRRRQRTPGECKACRHPLMGSSICPECGRAASVG